MNEEGSHYDRLFYPFLFSGGQSSADEVLAQVQHSTLQKCRDVVTLRQETLAQNAETIIAAAERMAAAFATGATLFAFGNGGSATDVQDLIADLVAPPHPDWQPLPALTLTNDVAVITAVGNDVGFQNIFVRQLIAFGREGDIAFGISTSGNSQNVIAAFEQAKKLNMITIALAGYDGGQARRSPAVDYCMTAKSDYIPRIQEAQATIYHTLLHLVHARLAAPNRSNL